MQTVSPASARATRRPLRTRAGVPFWTAIGALIAIHSIGDAQATAQRTFVASNGNDANPCSVAAPCRSFAASIAQTNDKGEIVVLDSAGYGNVTITKSVTIVSPPGIYAGISVFTGNDGITVNAPSGVIVLRGLKINGQGGNVGINFVQGAELRIERCDIAAMRQFAINASLAAGASIYIRDTTISGSGTPVGSGIFLTGGGRVSLERVAITGSPSVGITILDGPDAALRHVAVERNDIGILLQSGFGSTSVSIDESRIFANRSDGIRMLTGGSGVLRAAISDSEIVTNNQGALAPGGGIVVQGTSAGTGVAQVTLMRTRSSYNVGAGLLAQYAGVAIHVDRCVVVENTGYGLAAATGATVYTRGTSTIENNIGGNLNGVSSYAGK